MRKKINTLNFLQPVGDTGTGTTLFILRKE
ncbi:hypothetical protein SAMN05216391_1098 [Lachnospiraceae bacterium KHCPX20]|nr:hypothetical protein SAMN05216391_1098 [Lachnospiraceae bacterium KHCPX20]